MGYFSVKKKRNFKDKVGLLLFFILIVCVIYVVVRIIVSPSESESSKEYVKVRSDYVLMLLQCILGLIVMFIPSVIERKKSIDIPDSMEILYFIFLFLAIVLGVFCKRKFLTFANFFPHPIGGEFLIIAAIFQLFILRLLSRNT
jgi:protein-S-isoprenylcysteine O-methyltransferase Ste14